MKQTTQVPVSEKERKQINRNAAKVYRKKRKEEMQAIKERVQFLQHDNIRLVDRLQTISASCGTSMVLEPDPRLQMFVDAETTADEKFLCFMEQNTAHIKNRHMNYLLKLMRPDPSADMLSLTFLESYYKAPTSSSSSSSSSSSFPKKTSQQKSSSGLWTTSSSTLTDHIDHLMGITPPQKKQRFQHKPYVLDMCCKLRDCMACFKAIGHYDNQISADMQQPPDSNTCVPANTRDKHVTTQVFQQPLAKCL